jgi:nucleotide-binding universal stress UspA family protein
MASKKALMQSRISDPGVVRRIIIPIGATDREFLAQQWALELAASLGVPATALHIAPPGRDPIPGIFSFVSKEAKKWSVALETRTIESADVAEELIREAQATDLIVIGTRRLGTKYHLGSVAERVIRLSSAPVQVVRLE